MRVLLTGGGGYIGSHTAVGLAARGHEVVCFDNLCKTRAEVVERLAIITGQAISLVIGAVRDTAALQQEKSGHGIEAVIHFAGLKALGEAMATPVSCYDNNVMGTLSMITAVTACKNRTTVFSSSATVYGEPQYLPLDESHPTSATNPYGP